MRLAAEILVDDVLVLARAFLTSFSPSVEQSPLCIYVYVCVGKGREGKRRGNATYVFRLGTVLRPARALDEARAERRGEKCEEEEEGEGGKD